VHYADVMGVCVSIVVIVLLAGVLGRQRYMLRADGGIPVAIRLRSRWTYGIGRFVGGEFRWYRALGVGTRPTQVLSRHDLVIVNRRVPERAELSSLPEHAVIVECRVGVRTMVLAFSASAFTGFLSWLEASAPRR
jgi:uncharacterized protein DUF2550